MDKPIFEPGKEYSARGGWRIRVYAIDAGGDYPIHGASEMQDGTWQIGVWDQHGREWSEEDSDTDLMPPSRDWLAEIDACKPHESDTWADRADQTRRIVEILMDLAKTQVHP